MIRASGGPTSARRRGCLAGVPPSRSRRASPRPFPILSSFCRSRDVAEAVQAVRRSDTVSSSQCSRHRWRRLCRRPRLQGSGQSWLHARCLRQSLDRPRELRALGASGQGRHPGPRDAARRRCCRTIYRPCSTSRRAPMLGNRLPTPRNITRTMSRARCRCCGRCWMPAVRTIVFSSSCAIYGEPSRFPFARRRRKHPVNPYGASKLMVERMLRDYARAYGLQRHCA